MAIALDTNAVTALIRGDAAARVALQDWGETYLPVIAAAEYLGGVLRSTQRSLLEPITASLFESWRLLSITYATVPRYAEIAASLFDRGLPIPTNDVWIAALVLQHNLPLLSKDTHFDRVDGLRRISW